jgi:hypothetical protein
MKKTRIQQVSPVAAGRLWIFVWLLLGARPVTEAIQAAPAAVSTNAPTVAPAPTPGRVVSFRNEVMAVLSKAGCNAGPCHGNQNGKASFKLSLRGEDPVWDHRAMTRDMLARRVDPLSPDESLLLLKATTALAHEGGRRFPRDSDEYRVLRDWIAAGAQDDAATAPAVTRLHVSLGEPGARKGSKPSSARLERVLVEPANAVQLAVRAEFADGMVRDVTRLAVYEASTTQVRISDDGLITLEQPGETTVIARYLEQQVPVRVALAAARPGFKWKKPPVHNFIDREVFAKLRTLRINPSELCSDAEFIRRVHLDLLGLLPTADVARAFHADTRRDKRARLVEQLLERPEFAEFWALKWSDIARNEEKVLDRKGVQGYYDWIRASLADHKPMDQFVREIVGARGSTYENPAANFYRANRDAATRAEATAQLFLGTRLQCARCHNHPFDRWTQSDYYDWADVFARIRYKVLENRRRDGLDSHEFIGEQIVYLARDGGMTNARTGLRAHARFLGEKAAGQTNIGIRAPLAADVASATGVQTEDGTELDRLATWLTRHPNFARAQVNWVWSHVMGRGLVEPIDDFRPTNPATHPALLETLSAEFVEHRYDLRWLLRLILASRTYQLTSTPNDTNAEDEINYSHGLARRLTAEQLFDTQHQVLGVTPRFRGLPDGLRAAQVPGGSPVRRNETTLGGPEKFLAVFGKPARLLACECERSNETTLGQTFQLISSPEMNALLTQADNRLGRLLASGKSEAWIVDELYWTILSRAPSPVEQERATHLLRSSAEADRRAILEDLAWALLNAKEFVLRR